MRRKSITPEMMKSYIADSLLILMEKKDFQSITITEIVEKAGVNRSTYYRHFNTKEEIILFFLDNISKEILTWENKQRPDFREHLINVYSHYLKHKEQMLAIYRNGLSILFLKILKKHLNEECYKDKQVSTQYDIAFLTGGIFNHFILWFKRGMVDSPETMAQYTLSMLPESQLHHIRAL